MILSESIDSIRNDLDRPPNEVTLGFGELKNLLGEWFLLARGLEVGAGVPDLAKENETQIQILRSNLDALLKEQARGSEKQQNSRPSLSDELSMILKQLDTFSGQHRTIEEISIMCGLTKTQVNVRLDELKSPNLKMVQAQYEFQGQTKWCRSIDRDRYFLEHWPNENALADIDEPVAIQHTQQKKKHADLPELEQEVLVFLKSGGMTEKQILAGLRFLSFEISGANGAHILETLKEKGMIYDMCAMQHFPPDWLLHREGTKYLAERDLL